MNKQQYLNKVENIIERFPKVNQSVNERLWYIRNNLLLELKNNLEKDIENEA